MLMATSDGPRPPHRAVIIRTEHNRESVAQFFLTQFGFETYLPQVRKTVAHARKLLEVDRPFLPNYMFLYDDYNLNFRRIRETPGVAGVIRAGDEPSFILSSLINEIRSREKLVQCLKTGINSVPRIVIERPRESKLSNGESIRMKGPHNSAWTGLSGLFIEEIDDKRSAVFISLFGRLSKTTVLTRHVERV